MSAADDFLLDAPATSTAQATGSPRIYYIHPLVAGPLERWSELLDHAADLGFDTVLTAPPFLPGHGQSVFLPKDMDQLHPALGGGNADEALARLADEAGQRGLRLMVDLVVDRVARDSRFAIDSGLANAGVDVLDPRRDPAEREGLLLFFNDDPQQHPFLGMLAERLGRLVQAGVRGFRCLHWDRVPEAGLRRLVEAGRTAGQGTRFLAWTPGTSFAARSVLKPAGFDGAFSSLCWWNLRDSWLVDEHELHRAIGDDIAFPEAPFDKRVTHEVEPDLVLHRRAVRALRLAAALSDGLLVPMGFEFGSRVRLDPAAGDGRGLAGLREQGNLDLVAEVRAANRLAAETGAALRGHPLLLTRDDTAPFTAILRTDAADARRAGRAWLVLANADLARATPADADIVATDAGARFFPFRAEEAGLELPPGESILLEPGEARVLTGRASDMIRGVVSVPDVAAAVASPRLIIEKVTPAVDDGAFPVKRVVGRAVEVEADIFGDGHDVLQAALLWRALDQAEWQEVRMTLVVNDRWTASFPLERVGRYEFAVEAWRDPFAIFRYELEKKHAAGLDVTLELEEGRLLVEAALDGAGGEVADQVRGLAERLARADYDSRLAILMGSEAADVMTRADRRQFRLRSRSYAVDSERTGAEFASWYELFPRSQSGDPNRHGTFDDVIRRLPWIRDLGFDVLYLPPIHPIGRTHRKGKNNSLTAGPDDPGSPYAIGAEEGGHDAIHPELGTFEDFRRLVAAAAEHGMEVALDIAIQASPDHPWLKHHPDWFDWRPDGSIKYAENPPKKYEDIVNVDFYAKGATPSLWVELRDMILLWVEQGVKLFRIDNPHTKPFPFWEWLIADVRRDHPDVVFLAEAFTRPKVMYRLAKIGYSQSYTYFTWRNTKWELTEYLTELTQTAPKDFFRPHFFVNTPDINPDFLQDAPRSAYLIRAALATTLSGLWGMYNGFELCEGRPDAKKKEYADSEKYEIRAWDWDRPGNIIAEIRQLNRIRRINPALHSHLGVSFLQAWNDQVLFYEKATPGRENVLLIAVGLDPHHAQEADVELPLWKFGLPDHGTLEVEDLMRGQTFTWTGKHQRVRCDPGELPFSIWRVAARG